MDKNQKETLLKLRESFQEQLNNIQEVKQSLQKDLKKLKEQYEHCKKQDIFESSILDAMELTIIANEKKLKAFEEDSLEREKHYKELLEKVNQSLAVITS